MYSCCCIPEGFLSSTPFPDPYFYIFLIHWPLAAVSPEGSLPNVVLSRPYFYSLPIS